MPTYSWPQTLMVLLIQLKLSQIANLRVPFYSKTPLHIRSFPIGLPNIRDYSRGKTTYLSLPYLAYARLQPDSIARARTHNCVPIIEANCGPRPELSPVRCRGGRCRLLQALHLHFKRCVSTFFSREMFEYGEWTETRAAWYGLRLAPYHS